MHQMLMLVFCLTVVVVANPKSNAQQFNYHPYYYHPYYFDVNGGSYNYPNYYAYKPHRQSSNYYQNIPELQDPRFLFSFLTQYLTSTVTTTSTFVTTSTCTVSTSSVCSGRKRRFLSEALLAMEDEAPSDSITPSSVMAEAPQMTPEAKLNDRKEREAQHYYPYYYSSMTPMTYQHSYQFHPNDFIYPSTHDPFTQLGSPYQRNFFYHIFTSTTTTTTTSTTISKSYPTCSTTSSYNTC